MASVLDVLKEGIAEVFTELDSVAKSVSYEVAGTPTYNATTGAVTRPLTTVALKGFMESFSHREIDGTHVRVGDKRLLLERATAEAAAIAAGTVFAPNLDDRLTIGGVVHEVKRIVEDPGSITVELTIRRAV